MPIDHKIPADPGRFLAEGFDAELSRSLTEANHQLDLLRFLQDEADSRARARRYIAVFAAVAAAVGLVAISVTFPREALSTLSRGEFDFAAFALTLPVIIAGIGASIWRSEERWRAEREVIKLEAARLASAIDDALAFVARATGESRGS